MSKMPVIIALSVFLLLVLLLWQMEKQGFLSTIKSHNLCGHVIQNDLILNEDIICLKESLGALPREVEERFVFFTQTSGITIDCRGHFIQSEGGVGVFIEKGKGIKILNCNFIGNEKGIFGKKADSLFIRNTRATALLGGIKIVESDGVQIENCTINGMGEDPKWGMEFIGATNLKVENSDIKEFRYSGINLYGSENFEITKNNISTINDTGIGFFERDQYPTTSKGKITKNSFRWINNVGAFEVMHGAFDLLIEGNKIVKSKSAIYIYQEGKNGKVRDIIFKNNQVSGVYIPFTIHDGKNIRVLGNRFEKSNGAGIFSVKNSDDIEITQNTFLFNNGPGVVEKGVRNLSFSHNILKKHFGHFIKVEDGAGNRDFRHNYWDGKPDASRFAGLNYPRDITPYLDKAPRVSSEE